MKHLNGEGMKMEFTREHNYTGQGHTDIVSSRRILITNTRMESLQPNKRTLTVKYEY